MDQGLNWSVDRAINGLAGHVPALDTLAALAAKDLIFLIVLGAVVWWFLPSVDDAGKRAAIAAAAAAVCGMIVAVILSHLFYEPRPFVAHRVLLLVQHAPDSAFPSDHTTVAFAIAATALLRRMPGRWLMLIAGALIAIARVYVGVHYPGDVIAGAIIGSAAAVAVLWLDPLLVLPSSLAIGVAHRLRLG